MRAEVLPQSGTHSAVLTPNQGALPLTYTPRLRDLCEGATVRAGLKMPRAHAYASLLTAVCARTRVYRFTRAHSNHTHASLHAQR